MSENESHIVKKFEQKLEEATETLKEIMFKPTDEQKRVKANLHVALRENPLIDPKNVSLQQAINVTGEEIIRNWWHNQTTGTQFRKWLVDGRTIDVNLEKLFYDLTEGLTCICTEQDPKSFSAKVALLKTLAELTGRGAVSKREIKVLDNELKGKSKEQLRDMLEKGLKKA